MNTSVSQGDIHFIEANFISPFLPADDDSHAKCLNVKSLRKNNRGLYKKLTLNEKKAIISLSCKESVENLSIRFKTSKRRIKAIISKRDCIKNSGRYIDEKEKKELLKIGVEFFMKHDKRPSLLGLEKVYFETMCGGDDRGHLTGRFFTSNGRKINFTKRLKTEILDKIKESTPVDDEKLENFKKKVDEKPLSFQETLKLLNYSPRLDLVSTPFETDEFKFEKDKISNQEELISSNWKPESDNIFFCNNNDLEWGKNEFEDKEGLENYVYSEKDFVIISNPRMKEYIELYLVEQNKNKNFEIPPEDNLTNHEGLLLTIGTRNFSGLINTNSEHPF